MKVAITGGAGFIGSNLTYYLREVRPDWNLTIIDALTYAGNLETIEPLLDSVKFIKADIADRELILEVFSKENFNLVFHLAAESHVDRSILSGEPFVRTNVLGTQNLLDASRSTGVKRFVHVSTDEVYGTLGPTGRFVETTPLDPTSPYAASKAASDLMALSVFKTFGFDVVVTRCTNNYGPYHFPEKFIPLFITNALEDKPLPLYGDGKQIRSWLHVRDHARALLMVAEKGRSGEVYNIGGMEEAELTNKYVAELICKCLAKPTSLIKYVEDRPAHDRRYAIDYTKINKELGWKPEIPFEQGLMSTVQWYVNNKDWCSRVKSGAYLEFYEKNYRNRGL
jgi:dTDP-glucose 4,6-dehydratase